MAANFGKGGAPWWMWALMVVGGLWLYSEEFGDKATMRDKVPEYSLSADFLVRVFDENEIVASDKYSGKVLGVTGEVEDIGESFGKAYVTIGTGLFRSVHCTLVEDERSSLYGKSKGSTISVKGRCVGSVLGSPALTDCVVVY